MAQNTDHTEDKGHKIGRLIVRLAIIIAAVWLVKLGIDQIFAKFALFEADASARAMTGLLITVLIGYAVLLAIPFVPGVEIGAAVLMLQGAEAAPLVYGATVLGLFLAFVVGQYAPLARLIRFCKDRSLVKIGAFLENTYLIPRQDRLDAMHERLPAWLAAILCNYRYVTLGLVLNIPGNIALGGGGGIMLVGGLSRLFHTGYILLTIAIATLPVPLGFWIWGAVILP